MPTIAAQFRIRAGGGVVRLWFRDMEGGEHEFVLSPLTAQTISQHLAEAARALKRYAATPGTNRFRIQPGTPGGWTIGAPEQGRVPIVFHLAPGIEIELALPPEDSARLVEQIASARSLAAMPTKPNA